MGFSGVDVAMKRFFAQKRLFLRRFEVWIFVLRTLERDRILA